MSPRSIVAMAFVAVLAAACSTTSTNGNGVGNGFGSKDASADVSVGTCTTSFGTISCDVTIVNSSDGTSDYYIEAEIDDPSGANVGTANALVSHVAPGQTAKTTLDGVFTGPKNGLHVKLTTVQRTASA
jgi:hypothetical protein